MRLLVSEIRRRGWMHQEIGVGDRVKLLPPHLDAGRIGIVRVVDIGGAMVELRGRRPCFTWAGSASMRKEAELADVA
jgi:hypothetical protein